MPTGEDQMDRMVEAFEQKRRKYDEGLVSDCHKQGWRARCMPVKVRCRGFAGQSICRSYTTIWNHRWEEVHR